MAPRPTGLAALPASAPAFTTSAAVSQYFIAIFWRLITLTAAMTTLAFAFTTTAGQILKKRHFDCCGCWLL
jgi:hypothetical protein